MARLVFAVRRRVREHPPGAIMPSPVLVNVYDLGEFNGYIGWLGVGVPQTAHAASGNCLFMPDCLTGARLPAYRRLPLGRAGIR